MAGDHSEELAAELAAVGRAVRDVVRAGRTESDRLVVRVEGGDEIYGVDARADEVLIEQLRRRCGRRWPGQLVIEGFDDPVAVGEGGPWTYLADPVDGTRGLLAGLRSAWVLLGAGRGATTLSDLTTAAAVEIPTARASLGMVASVGGGELSVVDDDLVGGAAPTPAVLRPLVGDELDRRFVTVVRLLPGGHADIGGFADEVLEGWEVYDDLYPSSAGQLMAVAGGAAAAVIDPRPLLHPSGFATHPYDLAAAAVAQASGVLIEAVPPGPLQVPIDTHTPVAWAAYANDAVAQQLRPRLVEACRRRGLPV
jgi:fructose-1,6-bisphosphatase/inositol monophosphatase family enzyme